jgi:hypothetical protein
MPKNRGDLNLKLPSLIAFLSSPMHRVVLKITAELYKLHLPWVERINPLIDGHRRQTRSAQLL